MRAARDFSERCGRQCRSAAASNSLTTPQRFVAVGAEGSRYPTTPRRAERLVGRRAR